MLYEVITMLCGLQGAGKTTTCGKLARKLRRDKRQPLLVPADVYRPAAIEQLKTVGRQLEIPVFDSRADQDPVAICEAARNYAELNGYDTLILDTAGRLHVDEALMGELVRITSYNVCYTKLLRIRTNSPINASSTCSRPAVSRISVS